MSEPQTVSQRCQKIGVVWAGVAARRDWMQYLGTLWLVCCSTLLRMICSRSEIGKVWQMPALGLACLSALLHRVQNLSQISFTKCMPQQSSVRQISTKTCILSSKSQSYFIIAPQMFMASALAPLVPKSHKQVQRWWVINCLLFASSDIAKVESAICNSYIIFNNSNTRALFVYFLLLAWLNVGSTDKYYLIYSIRIFCTAYGLYVAANCNTYLNILNNNVQLYSTYSLHVTSTLLINYYKINICNLLFYCYILFFINLQTNSYQNKFGTQVFTYIIISLFLIHSTFKYATKYYNIYDYVYFMCQSIYFKYFPILRNAFYLLLANMQSVQTNNQFVFIFASSIYYSQFMLSHVCFCIVDYFIYICLLFLYLHFNIANNKSVGRFIKLTLQESFYFLSKDFANTSDSIKLILIYQVIKNQCMQIIKQIQIFYCTLFLIVSQKKQIASKTQVNCEEKSKENSKKIKRRKFQIIILIQIGWDKRFNQFQLINQLN